MYRPENPAPMMTASTRSGRPADSADSAASADARGPAASADARGPAGAVGVSGMVISFPSATGLPVVSAAAGREYLDAVARALDKRAGLPGFGALVTLRHT